MSVAAIRDFSRLFTQRVGALDDQFLGRDRPLGEARLLYEIGRDGAAVGELRSRLGLDSGYTSRLLQNLSADGLVSTRPDPGDRRRRLVELTGPGRREWELLDRLSDEHVSAILRPLDERRTSELGDHLSGAARLLLAATVTFDVTDAREPGAQQAMSDYFAELDDRFVGGFDPGDTLATDVAHFDPPGGSFVLVRSDDDVIGCGGVLTLESRIGEIKRMWIDPEYRALRLARRLLVHLEQRSREMAHGVLRLDTNAVLVEAIAMYESSGLPPDRPVLRQPVRAPLVRKIVRPTIGTDRHDTVRRSTQRTWDRLIVLMTASALFAACGTDGGSIGGGSTATGSANAANARVVEVVDGDTIVVAIDGREERVRLIGIDTPETKHPTKPVECFGPEASAFAAVLLQVGTEVLVERDLVGRDDYGRLLGYVHIPATGVFANRELVRRGYATPLTIEPNSTYAPEFAADARAAERENLGIWAECRG